MFKISTLSFDICHQMLISLNDNVSDVILQFAPFFDTAFNNSMSI